MNAPDIYTETKTFILVINNLLNDIAVVENEDTWKLKIEHTREVLAELYLTIGAYENEIKERVSSGSTEA